MASSSSNGQVPSQHNVHEIMRACACSEQRAINLLRRSGNDLEKAKCQHQLLMRYIQKSTPEQQKPPPASTPPSHTLDPEASAEKEPKARDSHQTGENENNTPVARDHNKYRQFLPEDFIPTNPIENPDASTSEPPASGAEYPHYEFPLKERTNSKLPSEDGYEEWDDPRNNTPPSDEDVPEHYPDNPRPASIPHIERLGIRDNPHQESFRYHHPLHPSVSTRSVLSVESDSNLVEDSGQSQENPSVLEPVHDLPHSDEEGYMEKVNMEVSNSEPEWDFRLPRMAPPPLLELGMGEGTDEFSIRDLTAAIQNGVSHQTIHNYLAYYERSIVKRHINEDVDGYPPMFYAVATNDEWVVRTFIAYGGDVNCIERRTQAPLLAYAIVVSGEIEEDTSLIVTTLLSLGASPNAIPSAFFTPYCKDLPDSSPPEGQLELSSDQEKWCTKSNRTKLAKTAHLTIRYYLDRASKAKKPSVRHRQIALRRNAEALLGIPHFLIGQTMAANRLLQKLLSHLVVPSKKPLVLVFAGPSGHGKTELARRLGHLLSLELEVVDCTIVNREMELFGPRHPYVSADRGSPLNNFLARNAGERCIVFLDEFEKTTSDIHQALLLPFDNGEYQDRRHLTKIDCSKTIWILATNACDNTIQEFCKLHEQPIFQDDDQDEKLRLMKRLSKELKEDFLSQFGSPITGRISAFLPFLPFTPSEQAVVVHKYLLELAQKVRSPVNLTPGPDEHLLGNVKLRIRRDASVCRVLADEEYHQELGARSLITAVKTIEDMLVEVYLDVDQEIGQDEEMVEFVVDINGGEIVTNMRKGGSNKDRGKESAVPSEIG